MSKACQNAGRSPDSVDILAVSKKHPAISIRTLHGLGQRSFGENYVSEALDKMAELEDLPVEWHYIGPIQSNKTRDIAEHFDWVQSVDRGKVLKRLSTQRPDRLAPLQICLQVNIDREPQKAGVLPEQLPGLIELAHSLPGIELRGLMVIPKPASSTHDPRPSLAAMNELFRGQLDMDTLSMGMSADLELAVANGSTMVRIGTDLLGPRPD